MIYCDVSLSYDPSNCDVPAHSFNSLFCAWQLQEEVDSLADRLEMANIALKEDWSRWQNNMRSDLRSAFLSTSEKNIEYYEKVSLKFTSQFTQTLHGMSIRAEQAF